MRSPLPDIALFLISRACPTVAGGPFKPGFGLSGNARSKFGTVLQAVAFEQSSSKARASSWAIIGAVAFSMTDRCIR